MDAVKILFGLCVLIPGDTGILIVRSKPLEKELDMNTTTNFNEVPKDAAYYTVTDLSDKAFRNTDGAPGPMLGHTEYDYIARNFQMMQVFRPGHEFRYEWDQD